MKIQVKLKNLKNYKGEKISDLFIKSQKNIKAINCPIYLNCACIDEFLLIFLMAKANGILYLKIYQNSMKKKVHV